MVRDDAVMPATLADLDAAAPSIAAFARGRIEATGLCFLGTTRADGWPRVSPIELFTHDGRMYVGSMPAAVKAKDLQRDPRCCVVTPLADKDDMAGEAKLFCRAREVRDLDEYEAVRAAFLANRGFDMGDLGGAHLFELGITGAAWQRVEGGEDFRTTSWSSEAGVRERNRHGAVGESVEL
jgi:hypothetical protein